MDFRELFNRHKWRSEDLGALTLTIRHRGAPGDVRRLSGAEILEITAGGLFVRALDKEGKPVDDGRAFIPYHRLLRVRHRTPGDHPTETVLFEKADEAREQE